MKKSKYISSEEKKDGNILWYRFYWVCHLGLVRTAVTSVAGIRDLLLELSVTELCGEGRDNALEGCVWTITDTHWPLEQSRRVRSPVIALEKCHLFSLLP